MSTAILRSSLRSTLRPISRTTTGPRAARFVRHQTTSVKSTGADSSHAVAGLAGGGVVLAAIYGYYHYSGTAEVINTARNTISSAQSAKDKLLSATPNLKDSLGLLRHAAKTYAGAIPGAAAIIDSSFDQLEKLSEEHGEQLGEVLQSSFKELKEAIGDGKDGGEKVVKALQGTLKKVQDLVGVKGGEAMKKILEKYPDLEKVVGKGSKELQELGDKYGPEVQKLVTSTYSESAKIITTGGMNAETITAIQKLITEKTKEVNELVKKSGSDAWKSAKEAAGPVLEKMPEVNKLVEERLGKLEGFVGGDKIELIKDLYSQLSELAKSKKSPEEMTKEAQKIVEKQFGSLDSLKGKAGSFLGEHTGDLKKYAEMVPGLGGLGKILNDTDFKHLKDLAEKHGDEAEKVLEGAYDDIKQVLKKRMEEAKKVAEGAKEDGKKEIKK